MYDTKKTENVKSLISCAKMEFGREGRSKGREEEVKGTEREGSLYHDGVIYTLWTYYCLKIPILVLNDPEDYTQQSFFSSQGTQPQHFKETYKASFKSCT